jgi:glycosyltransferase involved in cell wall biosynthesis
MIRFTVVTITYNAAAVVEQTLQSVLQQTFEDVEHLIIDGASTDNTLAMVEAYKAESDRSGCGHKVIVKSEPDEGIYDAMNKGLTQASGDYVVFLNAGDFFPTNRTLEAIVHRCQLNTLPTGELPAVLYGQTDIVDGEGHYLYPRRLRAPEQLTWRSFRQGMVVCHQAFYANVDIARQTGYDVRYRLSADVDWCIRVMKEADAQGLPMLNTGMVLCDYLDGGMSVTNHRASLLERFSIMRRHYGLLTTIYKHVTFLFRSW